jgi:hypothetical protein
MKSSQEILGSYVSRSQSPKIELRMQELIYDALRALMEESYLYRSHRIDIAEILAQADKQWPREKLQDEFEHRPWNPGKPWAADPIGTASRGMLLPFVVPTVKTWCFACKEITVHGSVSLPGPYPLAGEIDEPLGIQNFLFNLMCQECKSPPTMSMVRRELLKVQLCGRSHPFLPQPPPEIPKCVHDIFRDAVGAAACGDVFGALYHLRTLMEHHMKTELAMPITSKLDGDELCSRYNEKVDQVLRDRCSLKSAFDACSSNLHNRSGSLADYEKIVETVCAHFQLKQTLQKLNPANK